MGPKGRSHWLLRSRWSRDAGRGPLTPGHTAFPNGSGAAALGQRRQARDHPAGKGTRGRARSVCDPCAPTAPSHSPHAHPISQRVTPSLSEARLPGGSQEDLAQLGLHRAKGRAVPRWAPVRAGTEGPRGPRTMPGKGRIEGGRWKEELTPAHGASAVRASREPDPGSPGLPCLVPALLLRFLGTMATRTLRRPRGTRRRSLS